MVQVVAWGIYSWNHCNNYPTGSGSVGIGFLLIIGFLINCEFDCSILAFHCLSIICFEERVWQNGQQLG